MDRLRKRSLEFDAPKFIIKSAKRSLKFTWLNNRGLSINPLSNKKILNNES